MGYVSLVDGHIDNVEHCVCCGRVIPEGSQHCVICGDIPKKKRQVDRIRNMSVEEIARHIFDNDDRLLEKICRSKTNEKNTHCPHNNGDNIPDKCCINCVIEWLNSEVTEEGTETIGNQKNC